TVRLGRRFPPCGRRPAGKSPRFSAGDWAPLRKQAPARAAGRAPPRPRRPAIRDSDQDPAAESTLSESLRGRRSKSRSPTPPRRAARWASFRQKPPRASLYGSTRNEADRDLESDGAYSECSGTSSRFREDRLCVMYSNRFGSVKRHKNLNNEAVSLRHPRLTVARPGREAAGESSG